MGAKIGTCQIEMVGMWVPKTSWWYSFREIAFFWLEIVTEIVFMFRFIGSIYSGNPMAGYDRPLLCWRENRGCAGSLNCGADSDRRTCSSRHSWWAIKWTKSRSKSLWKLQISPKDWRYEFGAMFSSAISPWSIKMIIPQAASHNHLTCSWLWNELKLATSGALKCTRKTKLWKTTLKQETQFLRWLFQLVEKIFIGADDSLCIKIIQPGFSDFASKWSAQ